MDIKQYISSGVLEQYVLDQLSPAERREVEGYAEQYPEIKAELNQIEEALWTVASTGAVTPRAGLEQEIINKVKAEGSHTETSTSSNNTFKWLALIAFLAAAILGWMYLKNSAELVTEKSNHERYVLDCEENDALQEGRIQQYEGMIQQLLDNEAELVKMLGTANHPATYANVIYNTTEKATYLETANLPAPDSGKQYQLWAIVAGTPVDLGVFDPSSDLALIPMRFVEDAQAFAVTLEPTGGSATPTLEQMYVIGNRAS